MAGVVELKHVVDGVCNTAQILFRKTPQVSSSCSGNFYKNVYASFQTEGGKQNIYPYTSRAHRNSTE
jgi:hypothetical protein